MKKPFKETKLFQFVKERLPDALDGAGNLLPKGIKIISSLITGSSLDATEKAQLKKELYEIMTADVKNARDNETQRDISENTGWLTKNIHEIIGLLVICTWLLFDYLGVDSKAFDAAMLILGYLYGKSQPDK